MLAVVEQAKEKIDQVVQIREQELADAIAVTVLVRVQQILLLLVGALSLAVMTDRDSGAVE